MKRPTPTKFTPQHPEKYSGDSTNIWSRSSWELKVMRFFDESDNIIYWSSEELVIPYISPVDNRQHRYFPDFIIKVKNKSGDVVVHCIEVKPYKETQMPKRKTKNYLTECATYAVNQAKWKYADIFCQKQGWKFTVLTEYEIGIKKR